MAMPGQWLADDMKAALLAAAGQEVLVAPQCRVGMGKDRLQGDDASGSVHHRHQQRILDVAEHQSIAVAYRPRRHAHAVGAYALAGKIGVAVVGGHGPLPQYVGGFGRGILALALLPLPFDPGRFLALPDRALLSGTQRGR